MPEKFADKIVAFNSRITYTGALPPGFAVLNPYTDNPRTMVAMQQFYQQFYNDVRPRKFIIGINPSRNGAGVTGVPFTDTKRLQQVCGIPLPGAHTHEISSVFMYDMIAAYGGATAFYRDFFINSPFPLAITRLSKEGKWLNANYYDDPLLFEMVKGFMTRCLQAFTGFGLQRSEVFVLGKKNALFIRQLNTHAQLFDRITVLEHPRYIQQYKLRDRQFFIDKYLAAFSHND